MQLLKQKTKKIITGIAIVGSIIGSAFIIDKTQKIEIQQIRVNLVKKAEAGTLNYNEYLQLITEYNIEIKKVKKKGEKFKIKNIKNNSIIKELNNKIIN